MNYKEALDWLYTQLPMFQRIGAAAYKADLFNTLLVCKHLGNPEKKIKSIHIAGTNGKGSSSHLLASVLQEAGYKVGLFTSPHLKDFRERIRINGEMIPEEEVLQFVLENKIFFESNQLSFFEMTAALSFYHFANEQVDVAVIETGMGGRLDSTNVIKPLLAIITNIGWDHTQFLGDTLEKIAVEKAGIIKENTPIIICETQPETQPVFEKIAKEKNAPITFVQEHFSTNKLNDDPSSPMCLYETNGTEYLSPLKGNYQNNNLSGVFAAVEQLRRLHFDIAQEHLKKGIENVKMNTGFKGRWEILGKDPLIIADTAHNKNGLEYVLTQLADLSYDQLHMVLGFVNDKNVDDILAMFPKRARYYFTQANIPRAMPVNELLDKARKAGLTGSSFDSTRVALDQAKLNANKNDIIYIGGSTFVVAELI